MGAATGCPKKDHRTVVNAILWIDRTGAPWCDLPERDGPWKTVYSRFQRWRQAGVWDRVLAALHADADAVGEVNWEIPFVDGTTVQAHQHAAGAVGTDAATEALGRSRGGFSTKLHLRAEGTGKPLAVAITPGQRHESTVFAGLMRHGAVKRPGRGRPRSRPRRAVGDKGDRSRAERLINRLKQFRRVATRDEKRGPTYRAMVVIACILLWL